jgi:hypothetical protein
MLELFRSTFTSRNDIILIIIHNGGKAQVGDRPGMAVARQWYNFRSLYEQVLQSAEVSQEVCDNPPGNTWISGEEARTGKKRSIDTHTPEAIFSNWYISRSK